MTGSEAAVTGAAGALLYIAGCGPGLSQHVEPPATTRHRPEDGHRLDLHRLPSRRVQRGERAALERHRRGGDHEEPAGVRVLPGGRQGDLQLQHRRHPDQEVRGQDLGQAAEAGEEEQAEGAQEEEEGKEEEAEGRSGAEEQKRTEESPQAAAGDAEWRRRPGAGPGGAEEEEDEEAAEDVPRAGGVQEVEEEDLGGQPAGRARGPGRHLRPVDGPAGQGPRVGADIPRHAPGGDNQHFLYSKNIFCT